MIVHPADLPKDAMSRRRLGVGLATREHVRAPAFGEPDQRATTSSRHVGEATLGTTGRLARRLITSYVGVSEIIRPSIRTTPRFGSQSAGTADRLAVLHWMAGS